MKKFNFYSLTRTSYLLVISAIIQLVMFVLPVSPTIVGYHDSRALRNFIIIFVYLVVVTFVLLKINTYTRKIQKRGWLRPLLSFTVLSAFYFLYMWFSFEFLFLSNKWEFLSQETASFLSTGMICVLIGYAYRSLFRQHEHEKEVEQLKLESLQSRCEALTNQISPHFFFNLLSGLASLIRGEKRNASLDYLDEMSDVFRYIMRIRKETLVTLSEEFDFIDSYRYLLDIRFRNKLFFDIKVDKKILSYYKIPTLSLLPLVENVVKHNIIDSDHVMNVDIRLQDGYLVISNPIHEKLYPTESSHIGLSNLSARCKLLMSKDIKIIAEDGRFSVHLPLLKLY